MIRIVAILWTAIVAGLTAMGAISILRMPVSLTGLCMALLGCASLMAVICVGMIVQGMRGPQTDVSGADLITSSASPLGHSTRKSVAPGPPDLSQVGKPRMPARPKAPQRTSRRAEVREGEGLFRVDSQDKSATPE